MENTQLLKSGAPLDYINRKSFVQNLAYRTGVVRVNLAYLWVGLN